MIIFIVMNNDDNDHAIHNDDILIVNYREKKKGSCVLSKLTHSKIFIMKKRLQNNPIAHERAGLFL